MRTGSDRGPPVFADQGALAGNRGQHRVERRRKGGLNGVADDLEADTIVGADRLVENREVALDGGAHRRRVLLPTPGATLDVREQEGDSAARKVAHRGPGHRSFRLAVGILLAMLARGTVHASRPDGRAPADSRLGLVRTQARSKETLMTTSGLE